MTSVTSHTELVDFTPESFRAQLAGGLPVVVDFWAPWCGSCRLFALTLARVAADHHEHIVVGKLDVDSHPDLATEFDVQSVPTLLVFVDGLPVHRVTGAQGRTALEAQLRPYLAGATAREVSPPTSVNTEGEQT